MAQALTDALKAILLAKFQGGADGFRGVLEIDRVVAAVPPAVFPSIVQQAVATKGLGGGTVTFGSNVTPGNILLYLGTKRSTSGPNPPNTSSSAPRWGSGAWTELTPGAGAVQAEIQWRSSPADRCGLRVWAKTADSTAASGNVDEYSAAMVYELAGCTLSGFTLVYQTMQAAAATHDIGSLGSPAAGLLAFMLQAVAPQGSPVGGAGFGAYSPWTRDHMGGGFGEDFDPSDTTTDTAYPVGWFGHVVTDGSALEATADDSWSNKWGGLALLLQPSDTGVPATVVTDTFQMATIDVDRSRKMAAAQLDATIDNEQGNRGFYQGGDSVFQPNNRCRAYAWYGDEDNRTCIFTGLLDRLSEHRNPKGIAVKARSRMKWMLEQQFLATAPQTAGTAGAVRTEDNGVYVSKTIEYIVGDILDRAGWPSADRAITSTGITLAEYDIPDKTSWAEAIAGSDRLATAAGFDAWEDELGVYHFEPSPLTSETEPTPAWLFEAGTNVMSLDHEVNDETRATRVLVSGPMTSTVPKWTEVWQTSVLKYPAGVWYDPTDSANLRVIDRVTKRIYTMRQSDRALIASHYLGGYPLGLSGDPLDSTHYFVLNAPWRNTGSTTGNSLKEYRKSDNALLNTYSLPNGRWSAMKTDGVNVWLTNYDDGKLYKRTMTGGAVSSYAITYASVLQTGPTGLWIDGTTIGIFFAPFKRFLLVNSAAPGTVTGWQSTAGTHIAGGEADTTTNIDLYADADAGSFSSSGYVWKFTLDVLVTTDVTALSVDWDLEDALGVQSGIADRTHVGCPNDASPHAFEIRQVEFPMKVIQSLAQAQAVADAELAMLELLARTLDAGVAGHPGVQINDPVTYRDTVAGIDLTWVVDSYRASLSGGGTYLQTMSLLPWVDAP